MDLCGPLWSYHPLSMNFYEQEPEVIVTIPDPAGRLDVCGFFSDLDQVLKEHKMEEAVE